MLGRPRKYINSTSQPCVSSVDTICRDSNNQNYKLATVESKWLFAENCHTAQPLLQVHKDAWLVTCGTWILLQNNRAYSACKIVQVCAECGMRARRSCINLLAVVSPVWLAEGTLASLVASRVLKLCHAGPSERCMHLVQLDANLTLDARGRDIRTSCFRVQWHAGCTVEHVQKV